MARRPSYPKVSFEFKPKDADSTFIAGMILFFVLGGITLFIYVPIGLAFLIIGFFFLLYYFMQYLVLEEINKIIY